MEQTRSCHQSTWCPLEKPIWSPAPSCCVFAAVGDGSCTVSADAAFTAFPSTARSGTLAFTFDYSGLQQLVLHYFGRYMLASILTQQLAQSQSNASTANLTPFKTHSGSPSLRCSSDSVGLSGCRRGQMQHMGALVSNQTADPALRG